MRPGDVVNCRGGCDCSKERIRWLWAVAVTAGRERPGSRKTLKMGVALGHCDFLRKCNNYRVGARRVQTRCRGGAALGELRRLEVVMNECRRKER